MHNTIQIIAYCCFSKGSIDIVSGLQSSLQEHNEYNYKQISYFYCMTINNYNDGL